jgi:hypothetical protein
MPARHQLAPAHPSGGCEPPQGLNTVAGRCVAMSLDPRFTAPVDTAHFRGILPVAGKVCGVDGCDEPADAAEPQRRGGTFGVIWYCAEHVGEAPPGSAFSIVGICGAPADAQDDAACGDATTHVVLTEFDGVDGLSLVPLCERHATQIINSSSGSS